MNSGTDTRTPLQYAVGELRLVFDAARNVLEPAAYDVFVDIAVVFVAKRAAELVAREWEELEAA